MTARKKDDPLLPVSHMLNALLSGKIKDPHSVLGMHYDPVRKSVVVRCYDPEAVEVSVLTGRKRVKMAKIHEAGLFALEFKKRKKLFAYQFEKVYRGSRTFASADPYCFLPGIGDLDMHLFNSGEHQKVYDIMGAHPWQMGRVEGTLFCVWAPNAERVSVVGDFNNWDGRRHMMRLMGNSGIWELFIPGVRENDIYKFEIRDRNGGIFLKLDPFAERTELRPQTGGIVPTGKAFQWTDQEWLDRRENTNLYEAPLAIYEVHLASWQGPGLRKVDPDDDNDFHNYRELAHALADYVAEMGFTHIELLPVAEHPLDQSWGYQVSANYAPTARYGTPEDFAYFVNHLHSKGIGILLDWVPAHFPKDTFAMGRFDGTALFEHLDPRQGEHRDWGTYIYNYGRCEVRNYLIGNALYWLGRFHVDGLRVDAVASMLYLDYSREDGEWVSNQYGGNENLEAISFIKRLNELTNKLFPGTLMIAEESTAWPGVTRPVYLGGLGFSFKWNMGWMHDTLSYFAKNPVFRKFHHNNMTFSMLYAFSENFILPLSHDEVVHGKCSLIGKMSGDYWQKFANLRVLYTYMMTHPGKKLLFMGSEFAQWSEWNSDTGLDWMLLDYPAHHKLRTGLQTLLALYRETPALWQQDFHHGGFEWIDANDSEQSVFSYIRWDKEGNEPVVVIINLTPVVRHCYRVGVPRSGTWREIYNSDHYDFGGSGLLNMIDLHTEDQAFHGKPQSVSLTLPPLGAVVLKQKT